MSVEIKLEVDEKEVTALRNGGQVPLSLRDKLSDAVQIRDAGWYLVQDDASSKTPRPRWWAGTQWTYGPDDVASNIFVSDPDSAQRLYLAEEV